MTIRRRCDEWSCIAGRKCLEHLRFDVMPIQSMEEARDWERIFIGEVKAGRDPSQRQPKADRVIDRQITTVSAFLDAYFERCVKPAGLRSIALVRSQIGVLKEHLGDLALSGLEDPDEVNRSRPTMERTLKSHRFTAFSSGSEPL